ncbi:hypothetical protein RD792_014493 [Penstemon davidsonii]|uniref:RING-type domain-containing protein n=1 Tax=Penstemon davidsonii TaxID=160366 RepID=A0ABR0CR84_9LAMI|nr:hypothetical protein RD792_014493 [Penstemon davidsonii]
MSDQFVLCKAALIFAVTKWFFSFALKLFTSSIDLFSDSSLGQSSCCSSSTNLKMVKDNLSLTTLGDIEHRLSESHDKSCSVCLTKLKKKTKVWELNNCNHVFHKHCLEKWLSYDNRLTCPLCRASLVTVSALPYTSQPQPPSWAVERMLYLFGDDLLP